MAFKAKYNGRCQCGARVVERVTMITFSGGRVVGCEACNQGGQGAGAPAAQVGPGPQATETPRARAAAKQPRRPLPQPSHTQAAANLDALLARLDPHQRQIAAWRPGDGNLQAISGAGSGKTTTTVALVGAMVREGVDASSIIATTFTRKAAGELTERLAHVLPPGALSTMRVGTFHALAGRIMDRAAPGRFPRGRCLDTDGRAEGVPAAGLLWDKILGWAGPEGLPGTRGEGLGLEEPDVRGYMLAVDVVRSRPHADAAALDAAMRVAEADTGLTHLSRAWHTYAAVKAAINAWDFADLLDGLHRALTLREISDSARVVIVDEAQDNSTIQLEIARLLAAGAGGEVILVGDARQSIYGWRGAAPSIFRTADVTLGAVTRELPANYRSGKRIVDLGNRIAAGKAWSLGAASLPARAAEGQITVSGHGEPADEADAVAADIAAQAAGGTSLDSFAILARTNAQAAAFEAALVKGRIPCVVVGGTPFFTRREVADFLAYCRLSVADDLDALARIVNRPKRMLGKAFVAQVQAVTVAGTVADRVAAAAEGVRNRGQRDAARSLAALLGRIRANGWRSAVEEVGALLAPPENRKAGAADEDRSGILAAAVSLAETFEEARGFLDFAARCAGEVERANADDGLPPGRVVISTIHKAKGLEWPVVYLSATAGVFPHTRCAGSPERMEEEERLFYVAVTRAKDALHLSWSALDLRGREAGPSPFLSYAKDAEPKGPGPNGGQPAPEPAPVADAGPEAPGAEAALAARPAWTEQVAGRMDRRDTRRIEVPAEAAAPVAAPAAFDRDRWEAARIVAQIATDAEPHATAGAGGRYVQPTAEDFDALLCGLGFTAREEAGQVVFVTEGRTEKGTALLKVYSTLPAPGADARDVGEDSIKVAALWQHAGDERPRPLHKRMPYLMRTRGWRLSLLDRIAEVAAHFTAKPCARCGAPTVERQKKNPTTGEVKAFRGCVRFPECAPVARA